jgi:hypothetical protein
LEDRRENIHDVNLTSEMRESFIDYAMSVIFITSIVSLNIQVFNIMCIFFNEGAAWFYSISHQHFKENYLRHQNRMSNDIKV